MARALDNPIGSNEPGAGADELKAYCRDPSSDLPISKRAYVYGVLGESDLPLVRHGTPFRNGTPPKP